MQKIWAITFIILIVIYAVICLSQLWFATFSVAVFFKLSITFFILLGALGIIYLIYYTIEKTKKLQKDKFLD